MICPKDIKAHLWTDPQNTQKSLVWWNTDYLIKRSQLIILDTCVSEAVMRSTGIPQGGVLAPFLFILYIVDLK